MKCHKPIPSTKDLLRAERQVLGGVYGRLFARFIARYAQGYASHLAVAVAKFLLSQPIQNEEEQLFFDQNRTQIDHEIASLMNETAIRRIVTDTLVLRIVFLHKQAGCSSDDAMSSIEKLKEMGIYLEGDTPPTPGSFVRAASEFFACSPLVSPSPPSNS